MEPGPLELRDYLAIVWRRKWTIAGVAAVAVGAALIYSFRQTPLYTSTAEVIVRPARFDPTLPRAAWAVVNMVTEERVANSASVSQLAMDKLGASGVTPGQVSAAQIEDSETLVFTAVSPDPGAAQASAQSWAEAYLELRRDQVLRDLEAARRPNDERIAAITEELQSVAADLGLTRDEAEQTILEARYASLLEERSQVLLQRNQLVSPASVQVGEILLPAGFPASPSSPNYATAAGLALLAGLSIGMGMAYLRDRLDPRVRGRDELEVHSGAPVLACIPSGSPLKDALPITAADPTSELAESYKALCLRLIQAGAERGGATLVVTSSLAGEGKTSVVANLGVALAQSGKRVVVVSADLRRSGLERFFPGWDGTGLTEVLSGRRRLMQTLRTTRIENLWVLHAGPKLGSSNALELLSSDRMRIALTDLRHMADYVLVDTPPLLATLDATALAAFTDGVLYVADVRQASGVTVDQARRELELSGTAAIGVVVNRYDPRVFRGYDHRYSYGADGVKHEGARLQLAARPTDRPGEEQPDL